MHSALFQSLHSVAVIFLLIKAPRIVTQISSRILTFFFANVKIFWIAWTLCVNIYVLVLNSAFLCMLTLSCDASLFTDCIILFTVCTSHHFSRPFCSKATLWEQTLLLFSIERAFCILVIGSAVDHCVNPPLPPPPFFLLSVSFFTHFHQMIQCPFSLFVLIWKNSKNSVKINLNLSLLKMLLIVRASCWKCDSFVCSSRSGIVVRVVIWSSACLKWLVRGQSVSVAVVVVVAVTVVARLTLSIISQMALTLMITHHYHYHWWKL